MRTNRVGLQCTRGSEKKRCGILPQVLIVMLILSLSYNLTVILPKALEPNLAETETDLERPPQEAAQTLGCLIARPGWLS